MDDIDPESLEAFNLNETCEQLQNQALAESIANILHQQQLQYQQQQQVVQKTPNEYIQQILNQNKEIESLKQQLSKLTQESSQVASYVHPRKASQLDLVKLFIRERIDLVPTGRIFIDDMKSDLMPFAKRKGVDINYKEIPSLLFQASNKLITKSNTGGKYYYSGCSLRSSHVKMPNANVSLPHIVNNTI